MHQTEDLLKIANGILEPKGLRAIETSCKVAQNLWAGYGTISEILANGNGTIIPLIMKCVTPPAKSRQDEGYLRKLISYEVEQHFYSELAAVMPEDIGVSRCLGTSTHRFGGQTTMSMMLMDLREAFPVAGEKRTELSDKQAHAALDWLARFHGFWWKRRDSLDNSTLRLPPLEEARKSRNDGAAAGSVWLNGGYSYLATRQNEYASLQADADSEWSQKLCRPYSPSGKSIAELVAYILSPAQKLEETSPYQTLIHGDVKSENLFTTAAHDRVAFFDFQYVGIGLGVSDLAKFMTCSVLQTSLTAADLGSSSDEKLQMDEGEEALLRQYHRSLEEVSGLAYPWQLLVLHWNTALIDWLRFQASWGEYSEFLGHRA